jgi:Dolichyl-phosphate-mannose-protein mannosyltransferase
MPSWLSIIRFKWLQPMQRRQSLTVLTLLALAMLSAGIASFWGLPDGLSPQTTSSWAVDSIAPLGPLNEAKHRFSRAGVDDVIYPLFHYVVLTGSYLPYVGAQWLTGGFRDPSSAYPYGAQAPEKFFKHLTWIAALVSMIMLGGMLLALYRVAIEIFSPRAALCALLFAALIPPLTFYGATSNLDVPYLFWTMLAMWQLLLLARTAKPVNYVLCGAFIALSVATKDQAAGFFVALPLLLPWLTSRSLAREGRPNGVIASLFDRRVIFLGATTVVVFALANNLLFGWHGFKRHLEFADTFYAANIATKEVPLLARQPQIFWENSLLTLEMVGLPLLALIAFGLYRAWRQRLTLAWLLVVPCVTYYVTILAPTNSISRYLLGILLLLTPFAGLAVAYALDTLRGPKRLAIGALALLACLWQGFLLFNLHLMLQRDSRYTMEAWIRANLPASVTIESATQARYLPRLADRHRYSIVGNSFHAVDYSLRSAELTTAALAARNPEYIMVLADVGLSGDPGRLTPDEPQYAYFADLLAERSGYQVIARFETPSLVAFRQLTVGTQPTTILLRRKSLTNSQEKAI